MSSISPRTQFPFYVCFLITCIITFAFFGETICVGQRRQPPTRTNNRTGTSDRSTAQQPEEPLLRDPVIAAEVRRLDAQRTEKETALERELIARALVARTPSEKYRAGFRQAFKFHSQVIALSDPDTDGSRTLIVSEPPPHVTLGAILRTVGPELLLNHFVLKHPIGNDGWVKDVVISIRGSEDDVRSMVSRLNQRLFFTSYKSYTLKLPVQMSSPRVDLNLNITTDEIERWVVAENEQFFPVEGGRPQTIASLTTEASSGVYISRSRGLIGWWIPKSVNIYGARIPARQFALDADLVVGAISKVSGIFIVGRERVAPVEFLPPLRFETLALLADVQKGQRGELKQSYERGHKFAGRLDDQNDWAPILLSPELRDTEYGSLLNLTDQLLKGWSNKGQTKYRNFPYPEPPEYPFKEPLWKELGIGVSRSSLTYNWNTKGAGYTISAGGHTFLALNRTGALPVSYFPEGADSGDEVVVTAEDRGYDVFSRISDPNLVRVVQYAGLYQIFSAFNIRNSSRPLAADGYPDQLLVELTNATEADLKRASTEELNTLEALVVPALSKSLGTLIDTILEKDADRTKRKIDAELLSAGISPSHPEYQQNYNQKLKQLREKLEEVIRTVAAEETRRQLQNIKLNVPTSDAFEAALREQILRSYAAYKRLPQRYAEAVDKRAQGWIHTAVVVVSWNESGRIVGGHNLDARVSKIVTDPRIPPGEISINAKGELLINPRDVSRARGLARGIERGQLIDELADAAVKGETGKFAITLSKMKTTLGRAEQIPIRAREDALRFSGPPRKPPINKPLMLTPEPSGAGTGGWGGEGRAATARNLTSDSNAIVVFRESGQGRLNVDYRTVGGTETFSVRNLTHEDAVDAAVLQAVRRTKRGEPLVVQFEGIPDHKARATLRTMEIRLAEAGESVELIGLIGDQRIPPDALSATLYDFGRSSVESSPVSSEGGGFVEQGVSLNVPDAANSGRSLSFNSQLRFDSSTPRPVVSAVSARISRMYQSMAARWARLSRNARYRGEINSYERDLALALRKLKATSRLDFDVTTELRIGSEQGLGDRFIHE